MSTNLKRFESEDGIEIVINTITSEIFTTQSGYARMAGLTQQAINTRCKINKNETFIKGEILTRTGLKTVILIPINISINWLIKDNSEIVETKIKFIKKIIPSFEL